jgi:competence ComEA-like helix-hairpin-helix protein
MNPLKQFLYFTKPHLRGVIALIALIIIVPIAPRIYFYFNPPKFDDGEDFRNEILAFQKHLDELKLSDSLSHIESPEFNPYTENHFSKKKESIKKEIELFPFNPNTIGVEEWQQLGMTPKQAEVIEKIKAKGFRFRKAEDLMKTNVIGEKGYERLKNYVTIPQEKKVTTREIFQAKDEKQPYQKIKINLNLADTFELIKLNGIGASYARRIFKYRTILGGFYEIEQLKEVWNLPDSTIQKITPYIIIDAKDITTIPINTAELEVLGKHPYIKYTAGRLLIAYREQHGYFKTIEASQRAMMLNDSAFNKVKPYLRLE